MDDKSVVETVMTNMDDEPVEETMMTNTDTDQAKEVIEMPALGAEAHNEKLTQKIYVGPNLLGLPKYTVVMSIEVPIVQAIIEECAAVEKLFIDIEEMAEIEARVATKGTLEHRYYHKVIEYINSKKKGV